MGMINKAQCDWCGVEVNCGKDMNGSPSFPPNWHIVHWQERNMNQSSTFGVTLLAVLSYCDKCGPDIFKNARGGEAKAVFVLNPIVHDHPPNVKFKSGCAGCKAKEEEEKKDG